MLLDAFVNGHKAWKDMVGVERIVYTATYIIGVVALVASIVILFRVMLLWMSMALS